MLRNEIRAQKKVVDKIYQEFLGKFSDLRKQQDETIKQFGEALKQEKLVELREKLNTHYDKS